MERFPSNEQNEEQPKQVLQFDALGPTGNVFYIIGKARGLLEGEQREAFMEAIKTATAPDAGKGYDDILSLVSGYVRLEDISGQYPQYGSQEAGGTPTE